MLLKHFVSSRHFLLLQMQPLFCGAQSVAITIDPGDEEIDIPAPGEVIMVPAKRIGEIIQTRSISEHIIVNSYHMHQNIIG